MNTFISRLLLASLLLLSGPAPARDAQAEIKRLQSVLDVINGELHAAYQQYQMIVEARRNALVVVLYGTLTNPTEPMDYLVVQKERENAFFRDKQLADQMDQILGRIKELESRKQPILERVYGLISELPSAEGAQSATPSSLPAPGAETPAAPAAALPGAPARPRSDQPIIDVPTRPTRPMPESPSIYTAPGN